MFQKNSGGEKVFGYAVGVLRLSFENFLSHSAENFRRGGFFSVSLISGMEKILNKGGGVSRFSVGHFLSHSTENFCRGSLYCCKNFGCRKSSDKRGEGYQDFPSKFFCLTVPKI